MAVMTLHEPEHGIVSRTLAAHWSHKQPSQWPQREATIFRSNCIQMKMYPDESVPAVGV